MEDNVIIDTWRWYNNLHNWMRSRLPCDWSDLDKDELLFEVERKVFRMVESGFRLVYIKSALKTLTRQATIDMLEHMSKRHNIPMTEPKLSANEDATITRIDYHRWRTTLGIIQDRIAELLYMGYTVADISREMKQPYHKIYEHVTEMSHVQQ